MTLVAFLCLICAEDTAREILDGLIPARVTAKCVSFKYPKSFTERDQLNHILGGTDGGPIWYKKVHDQSTTELCETDFKQTFWLKYVRLPVGVILITVPLVLFFRIHIMQIHFNDCMLVVLCVEYLVYARF